MTEHRTGTREEWLAARLELLDAEKELTRRGDELARTFVERRIDLVGALAACVWDEEISRNGKD